MYRMLQKKSACIWNLISEGQIDNFWKIEADDQMSDDNQIRLEVTEDLKSQQSCSVYLYLPVNVQQWFQNIWDTA